MKVFHYSNGRCTPGLLLIVLAITVCSSLASAGEVSFQVTDATGAEAKNVLVIIQDLRVRDSDEVFRALTNAQGRVPTRRLEKGLYRMIAVTPYGLWKPFVREFLVGIQNSEVVARLEVLGSHGYGDIVTVPQESTIVELKQRDGTSAPGIDVHVRDSEATLDSLQWYKTDQTGQARIRDVGKDTVVIIVTNDCLIIKAITSDTHHVTIQLP